MKQKKLLASLVAFVCFSALLRGDQTQTSVAGSGQDQATFRVNVDLITTDVIPRDASGQFVADLTKEDFQVYEDDVLQTISSVVLVHGGRVFNQVLPPPPPPQEGIILPPVRPTNDTAGR